MKRVICVGIVLLLAGCAKKPTAMEVCKKVEASGVGANCREGQPGGLGAAAVENAQFDLPSVAGKTGQVMRFDSEEFYANTETAYGNAAMLAGPHRYGSKKALIFVQANDGLSVENGKKLKDVVDGL